MTEVARKYSTNTGAIWARKNRLLHNQRNAVFYAKNKLDMNRRRKKKFWKARGKSDKEIEFILTKRRYCDP